MTLIGSVLEQQRWYNVIFVIKKGLRYFIDFIPGFPLFETKMGLLKELTETFYSRISLNIAD